MAVVGRERELAVISDFLKPTADGPSVLVIEGDTGMGKTTLCHAAADMAPSQGHRVLRVVPAEAETQLAFAGLRELVGALFDEVQSALPEPQRHALAIALVRQAPEGPPPDQGSVAFGLLNALRVAAADAPVLVVVDDVQWLDASSARALAYVIRRAGGANRTVLGRRRGSTDELAVRDVDGSRVRRGRVPSPSTSRPTARGSTG